MWIQARVASCRRLLRKLSWKLGIERRRRRKLLLSVWASGKDKASSGPCAARSQDFLYDEFGLPK